MKTFVQLNLIIALINLPEAHNRFFAGYCAIQEIVFSTIVFVSECARQNM